MCKSLTHNDQIDFSFKWRLRHNVAGLAAEPCLIVTCLRCERVDVFRHASVRPGVHAFVCGKNNWIFNIIYNSTPSVVSGTDTNQETHVDLPVGHAHLRAVLVPDQLGGRIAAATAARQLDGLAAAQRLAVRVAFDVWRTGRICIFGDGRTKMHDIY